MNHAPHVSGRAVVLVIFGIVHSALGQLVTIPAPPGSGNRFGDDIRFLPNGNIVVIDTSYSSTANNVGAVHLYRGSDLSLISTLRGSTAGDSVGNLGITILANGHFVVASQNWDDAANGLVDAGAATWVHSENGLDGPVSAANSLVGGSAGDFVGRGALNTGVVALTNGHYVVGSVFWKPADGTNTAVGAATWCDGNGTTVGTVTAANSLVGSTTGDRVGTVVAALANGHYVAGSATWDQPSPLVADVGAIAWANGNGGLIGPIGPHNALVGSTAGDNVGTVIEPLPGGDYAVCSQNWDLPAPLTANVGAVTWCDGATGRFGPVAAANSLHGSTADDRVGQTRPVILPNGKYVIASSSWDKPAPGPLSNVGAVTLCQDGLPVGPVTAANSLTGGSSGDIVSTGSPGITVLANGHFVVASQFWRNPDTAIAAVGAVTWCDGNLGRPGQTVTPANSLIGGRANDWFSRVVPLDNGNFVAHGPNWDLPSPARTDVGAVVWCDGNAGRPGETVSPDNALVGSTANDLLGDGGRVVALSNGHYVVCSHVWDLPSPLTANVGAAIWCNGNTGRTGPIPPAEALRGSAADDRLGARGVFPLANGHYVVPTGNWSSSRGAVTWCDGFMGTAGEIDATNSLVGSLSGDGIGDDLAATPDGNYHVVSDGYTHNGVNNAGAVTYGFGVRGTRGPVSATNSVFGTTGGSLRGVAYDPARNRLFVGRGSPSAILVFRPPPLADIASISKTPTSLQLSLPLAPDQNAGIEYTETLPPPDGWRDLGPVTIESGVGTFTDTDPTRLARPTGFYRAYPR
jgi:hypothetical protein